MWNEWIKIEKFSEIINDNPNFGSIKQIQVYSENSDTVDIVNFDYGSGRINYVESSIWRNMQFYNITHFRFIPNDKPKKDE